MMYLNIGPDEFFLKTCTTKTDFLAAMRLDVKSLALLCLHLTVFLWGCTAILGKLITYSSFTLVWHRMVITSIVYLCIPSFWSEVRLMSWDHIAIFMGIGLLLCVQWLLFYASVKLGDSASITLACLGSVSFFSSLTEPLIATTKFYYQNLLLGCVVLVGIIIMYQSMVSHEQTSEVAHVNKIITLERASSHPDGRLAIITGLVSALLAALFYSLNKLYVETASALVVSALEISAGALFLTLVVPCMYQQETVWYPSFDPSQLSWDTVRSGPWDLIWVLVLSLGCTNFAFFLSNWCLKHLSAFTTTLVCNLEPLYGIVLGALIFQENRHLTYGFYLGASIILVAVLFGSLSQQWSRGQASSLSKSASHSQSLSSHHERFVDTEELLSSVELGTDTETGVTGSTTSLPYEDLKTKFF